jgi:hypothetical protein
VRRLAFISLVAAAVAACSENPTAPVEDAADAANLHDGGRGRSVRVTNNNDDGHGSFRWAVAKANEDPRIASIRFRHRLRPIALQSTVTFTGPQDLSLHGDDVEIDAAGAGGSAFVASGGGDLEVNGLSFRNAPGEGLAVEVPSDARGRIKIVLRDVTIADNQGHGFLVDDQDNPVTEDGVQPDSSGSEAGLYIEVIDSRFLRNGYSVSDRDGIRINEGAEGGLVFVAHHVRAEDNAADGIELDERGSGDVRVHVRDAKIVRNGPSTRRTSTTGSTSMSWMTGASSARWCG